MSRIVITGVSSFVGFHLARHFAIDHEILGTHSRPKESYEGIQGERLTRLVSKVNLVQLELTEPASIINLVSQHKPDYWIHHAAWAKKYSEFDYDLDKSFQVNTLPLYTLYPALEEVGCKGVLVTGSSAEYSNSGQPHVETDLAQPATPYGISKLSETLAAMQLAKRHGLATRVIRLYIPFGPLDNPEKLIPYTIDKLQKNEPVSLSPCTQQRDFIYIDDVLAIYSACLDDLGTGGSEVYNASSGVATPVRELLDILCMALGKPVDLLKFGDKTMREGEVMFSVGSFEKLRSRLSMSEVRSLHDAVENYLALKVELDE